MAGSSHSGYFDDVQDDVFALAGSNWRHYVDATRILDEFLDEYRDHSVSDDADSDTRQSVPASDVRPVAENTLEPIDGYLCFYCHLLGFSEEMRADGMDSLPDYYGAAYVVAARHPSAKVYLLSDSFTAFAPAGDAAQFIEMIQSVIANWCADGLLPQCSIGYGTFVERKPKFGRIPNNFCGVQIAGTALVDAVKIQKKKPLGTRILMFPSALDKVENLPSVTLVNDFQGNVEFLNRNPRRDMFDRLYYLMCLQD